MACREKHRSLLLGRLCLLIPENSQMACQEKHRSLLLGWMYLPTFEVSQMAFREPHRSLMLDWMCLPYLCCLPSHGFHFVTAILRSPYNAHTTLLISSYPYQPPSISDRDTSQINEKVWKDEPIHSVRTSC